MHTSFSGCSAARWISKTLVLEVREQNFSLHWTPFSTVQQVSIQGRALKSGVTPATHGSKTASGFHSAWTGQWASKSMFSFRFYSQCALNLSYIVATWKLSEKLVTCLHCSPSNWRKGGSLSELLQAHFAHWVRTRLLSRMQGFWIPGHISAHG